MSKRQFLKCLNNRNSRYHFGHSSLGFRELPRHLDFGFRHWFWSHDELGILHQAAGDGDDGHHGHGRARVLLLPRAGRRPASRRSISPSSSSRPTSPAPRPEEIETEVTKKIEESINTIAGIDELQSISYEGRSQVIAQFVLEKNADVAAQEVRDRVNRVLTTSRRGPTAGRREVRHRRGAGRAQVVVAGRCRSAS